MRQAKASGWRVQSSSRALRLAVVALGVGLVMTAGVARAQDDEDDGKTFEERIIDGLMAGVGATNMENRGIDYRERSPLVVPPKLDLPPPESAKAAVNDPNWPKDPDEQRRKAAIAARKKTAHQASRSFSDDARLLTPAEMGVGKTASTAERTTGPGDQVQPGQPGSNLLSPTDLGYSGGFMGLFRTNKDETVPFTGEPARNSLTEPPAGYQTPSPNFAYGTGPADRKSNATHTDIMTGKEVPN